MKRLLSTLLVISLIIGSCTVVLAEDVTAKLTKEQIRLTAYLEYLKERFEDGGKGKIMYVGVGDVNKDTLPELFYVWRQKSGECWFHFCYYDGAVEEYDFDDNYLSYNTSYINIIRLRKSGTSEHCWVLESKGKTKDGYNERMINMILSAVSSEDTGIRFRKTWKGSGLKYRYYIDEEETVKVVYNNALIKFKSKLVLAETTRYRNTVAVRKVPNRKNWLSVRNAFNKAAVSYINMR